MSGFDDYSLLKQDVLVVYNTQICNVVHVVDPLKDATWAVKKYHDLMDKYKDGIANRRTWWLIIAMVPIVLLILSGAVLLAMLVGDVFIGAMLGWLAMQLCQLAWIILDTIFGLNRLDIPNRKSKRLRKRGTR